MTRPLDATAIAVMLMLCLSWGFNQVAVKLALPDIPVMIQALARSIGATLIILVWVWLRGIRLFERDRTLFSGLLVGLLFGLEFLLMYRGLLYTAASRAVLFIYTMPFFVVIGSRWLLPGDRFAPAQWAGLALSFVGIAVAFGVPAPSANPHELLGDILVLGGAVGWAATTLAIKASALAKASPEKTILYQLVVSAVMFAIAVPLFGETITAMPSLRALSWLGYQTVWVVAITFLIWFGLVVRYSASRLSVFSFLTPLFGVAAGHFMLGEPLTWSFGVAVALVALGLILVNRPR